MNLTRFPIAASLTLALALAACGPGEVGDDSAPEGDLPADVGASAGVVGDPWNCGELGLTCVGAFGTGECIDGECRGRISGPCWSPEFAPSCAAYCESIDQSCAYLECKGATAYGWMGSQAQADLDCQNSSNDVVAMTVTCEQPLDGLVTTVRCCCT